MPITPTAKQPRRRHSSDFVIVRSTWRNQLWATVSEAAKTKQCFADSDFNAIRTLDSEQAKFKDLRDRVMLRCDKTATAQAGSPDWSWAGDKTWELTFVVKVEEESTGSRAYGKDARKWWSPGVLVEGGLEPECPDETSSHWQLVNEGKIPAHDELDHPALDNGDGQKWPCTVM